MSRSVSAPSSVTNTSPCWNGLIVPGSTLRYGSNFCSWTRRPRAFSSRPSDAATIPFPSAETTPPVTKTYFGARALTGGQGSSGSGCEDPCVLRVAAAAVVEEGRLLLVSKRAAPDVYYLPGGKPEPGEPAEACVRRELAEELGVAPASLAALERVPMAMDVFLAEVAGEPEPASEIAELAWYGDGAPFSGRLAPAISG